MEVARAAAVRGEGVEEEAQPQPQPQRQLSRAELEEEVRRWVRQPKRSELSWPLT